MTEANCTGAALWQMPKYWANNILRSGAFCLQPESVIEECKAYHH